MLIYREATINDIEQLELLEQAVVEAERPFNTAIRPRDVRYYDIADLISSKDSCLLVAENKNTDTHAIVATGYLQIRLSKAYLCHEKHGYLGFMYVDPNCRGRGINKTVLEKLMSWGSLQGVKDFYLDVYSANEAAIKAYEKAGFRANLVEMKLNTGGS